MDHRLHPRHSTPVNRTGRAWSALLALLCGGCTSFAPESSKEKDYGVDTVDTGTDDPIDTGETAEPIPSGYEVCYPGARAEVCLPLVEHSDSWGADYEYPAPYQGSAQYIAPARFLDLRKADPSLFLSDNFLLQELMQEYKGRYGMFQVHALESLQALRELTGGALYVNSAYRNVTYNQDAEGATHSRHMFGDAVDMYSGVTTLQGLADACGTLAASYVSLYATHVHCDWRNHSLDPAFFDVEAGPAGPPPTHSATLTRTGDLLFSAEATGFDEGEPLRQWRALDEKGHLLESATSRTYTPPPHAHRIEVVVGGQVVLTERLSKQ